MRVGEGFKTTVRTHQGLFDFKVMPFGLTNALTTLQSLINNVFKPYLRKFVLVFFDDNLIYSPDLNTHLQHLRRVFKVMREQELYAKMSKCSFPQSQTECLGHIIVHEGMKTYPTKLEAVKNWPKPKIYSERNEGLLGLKRLL